MSAPSSLFKYQPFNAQTLSNLLGRAVYFSSPRRFNDPYDCQASFVSDAIPLDSLGRARQRLKELAKVDGRDRVVDQLNRASDEELLKVLRDAARNALVDERTGFLRERGVACFGSRPNDLLMWGHYADGHRGFCIEIDATKEPWSAAHQVKYVDELPQLNLIDMLLNPDHEALFQALVLSKARCWEYEAEYRVLHQTAGTVFGYGWENLKAVYFGAEMDRLHKELIGLVLRDFPTRLYEMQKDPLRFELVATQVQFTAFKPGASNPTERKPK